VKARDNMLRLLLLFLLSIPGSARSLNLPFEVPAANNTMVLSLLDGATGAASGFPPSERIEILVHAAEAAAPLDAQRADAWSRQAFDLAQQISSEDRLAMEKNALRVLAINDPDTALSLYRQQGSPLQEAKPGEPLNEDPRALSVPSIFSVIWSRKRRSYLDRLQSLAAYLGETGQYPYRPMSSIASDVGKSDPKRARGILKDATRFYASDPGFITTNGEFVDFILKTHDVANRTILRSELDAALHGLEHPRVSYASQIKFRISVTTPLGDTQFDSETDYLLFRLLPLVKLADSKAAKKLVATHPPLQHAPAIGVDTPVAMAGAASPTGTASDERMRRALDRHRVFRSSQMANTDPVQALAVAEQIGDATLRATALVQLAPHYQHIDGLRADDWLREGSERLSSDANDLDRLQLMVALISADVALQRKEAARQLLPRALQLAQQIVSDDLRTHPDKPTYALNGFDQWEDLFAADAAVENLSAVEARLAAVQNSLLRAHLTVTAAQAVSGEATR